MDTFDAEVVGGPYCGQPVTVDAEEVTGGGRVTLTLKNRHGESGKPMVYQVIAHPSEKRSWVGLHYLGEAGKVSR